MTDQGQDRGVKAHDFLRIVQTGLLAIAASVRRSDPDRKQVAEYSGTGVFMHADEAVRAAGLIPDDMTTADAAEAFCDFYGNRGGDRKSSAWFGRPGDDGEDYRFVSKTEQFLWVVQTSLLANMENRAHHGETHDPMRTRVAMAEAIRVAPMIPTKMEAGEAASQFYGFYAPGVREKRAAPKWCTVKT